MRPLLSITFPKDSESLKILDIQLQEVGAKRPLNGTSKSEQTDRHTHIWTNRLIEGSADALKTFKSEHAYTQQGGGDFRPLPNKNV